ncbi:hypothetical protein DRQ20_02595, partial [bacterium]
MPIWLEHVSTRISLVNDIFIMRKLTKSPPPQEIKSKKILITILKFLLLKPNIPATLFKRIKKKKPPVNP